MIQIGEGAQQHKATATTDSSSKEQQQAAAAATAANINYFLCRLLRLSLTKMKK